MANFKIIPYRDNNGYIIQGRKAFFVSDKTVTKASGGYAIANLIWCPEREGLRWIGHCENCELFAGHKQHEGVICQTNKPINAGKRIPDYKPQNTKPK